MAERAITPILIGTLVGAGALMTAAFYFFAFSLIPGGAVIRWIVVAAGVAILAAVTAVVRRRIQEIKQEDPNDYRNY